MSQRTSFVELEQKYGDLHIAVLNLLRQHGKQEDAARALGVSPSALSQWLRQNGYTRRAVWVREEGGE